MFRDPVKREISQYHYVRRSPDHKDYHKAKNQTLEEFVLATKGNLQTRLIYGLSDTKIQNGDEMLDIAKQHLNSHFSAVGLVERFDESLVLFQDTFGWHTPVYVKQNYTRAISFKNDG